MSLIEYNSARGKRSGFTFGDRVEFWVSHSDNLETYSIGQVDVYMDYRENIVIIRNETKDFLMSNIFDLKKLDSRPTWTQYFLEIAQTVKTRSHDAQTQHGCVITDTDHHIVGTGYNGFPPGVDDSALPKERPEKYPYVLHAEENAILNATRPLKGCTMYVTGKPCVPCLRRIMAVGITHVYYDATKPAFQGEAEESEIFNKLLNMSNVVMIQCG